MDKYVLMIPKGLKSIDIIEGDSGLLVKIAYRI